MLTHACEPLNGRQVCASPQKPRQCETESNAGVPPTPADRATENEEPFILRWRMRWSVIRHTAKTLK